MRSAAGQDRSLISIFQTLITSILLIISLEIGEINISVLFVRVTSYQGSCCLYFQSLS